MRPFQRRDQLHIALRILDDQPGRVDFEEILLRRFVGRQVDGRTVRGLGAACDEDRTRKVDAQVHAFQLQGVQRGEPHFDLGLSGRLAGRLLETGAAARLDLEGALPGGGVRAATHAHALDLRLPRHPLPAGQRRNHAGAEGKLVTAPIDQRGQPAITVKRRGFPRHAAHRKQ
jgi:hypothetical protein